MLPLLPKDKPRCEEKKCRMHIMLHANQSVNHLKNPAHRALVCTPENACRPNNSFQQNEKMKDY